MFIIKDVYSISSANTLVDLQLSAADESKTQAAPSPK
jgi:hypothetical protein